VAIQYDELDGFRITQAEENATYFCLLSRGVCKIQYLMNCSAIQEVLAAAVSHSAAG
jgi:hypothetical protein